MTEWVGVLVWLLGQVTVNVAPDQPLPHVFEDDPLILEFVAEDTGTHSATVQLDVELHPPQQFKLNGLLLKANRPYWHSFKNIEPLLGLNRITMEITNPSGKIEKIDTSFYRIHRPDPSHSFPITVHLKQMEEALLARHLPAKTLRIDQPIPTWNDWLDLAEYHQLSLEVIIDPTHEEWSPLRLETAAERLMDRIHCWIIIPPKNNQSALKAAQAIRRGNRNARLAFIATTPNEIGSTLINNMGVEFDKLVVRSSQVPPHIYRSMVERLGREGLAIDFDLGYVPSRPTEFLKNWLDCLTVNVQPVIPRNLLEDQSGLAHPFGALNAWANGFHNLRYQGNVTIESGESFPLFRAPGTDTVSGHSLLVNLGVSSDEIITAENQSEKFDGLFNALQGATQESKPTFFTSNDPSLLARAAWNRINSRVNELIPQEAMMDLLSEQQQNALHTLRQGNPESSYRRELFQLLQSLPPLEARLRAGITPKELAVPLSAALGTIAESLAVLEETIGEPFLEPLSKILAQCGDLQSRYIIQSGGSGNNARSAWLLSEVNRLLVEVEALRRENRLIHATAIATLAEWRARSLVSTFK